MKMLQLTMDVITLDALSFSVVMQLAKNRALREEVYRAIQGTAS
jgi:Zn-dependent oligopeptidase